MTHKIAQFDLTGRSALVTGAGVGIGSTVAEAFAVAGAAVLVADANVNAAATVAERILINGGRADYVRLDARDHAAAEAAAARAADLADGVLHILVNHAGAIPPAMLSGLTKEAVKWMLDVHLVGAFHCSEAARPYLPTDGTGRIINVASSASITGAVDRPNCFRSTTGIIGLTKSLAHDLEYQQVLVNAVSLLAAPQRPEAIRKHAKFATTMLERNPSLPSTGEDDHAGVFVFLASEASNFTGQVLPVGGGTIMNISESRTEAQQPGQQSHSGSSPGA